MKVSIISDIADELVGQEPLPVGQIQHLELLVEVVAQVVPLDGNPLEGLGLGEITRARSAHLEPVQEDLFPVRLFLLLGLCALFLFIARLTQLHLVLGLDQLEERVDQQFLLEVLLQIEERHVQQIHRLVQAWIHPQFLAERHRLLEGELHAAAPRRSRSRAVSVGPK